MNKFVACILLVFLSIYSTEAQVGGISTYKFLSTPLSGRLTGLGNAAIAIDGDLSLGAANPSLLNEKMHRSISFNHNFIFAGISSGFAGYAHHLASKKITMFGGIQYVNYGEFRKTNEYDISLGTFKASEMAVFIGASKQLNERILVGANLKPVFSTFDTYSSMGLTADLALTYTKPNSNTILTFLMKNIGGELKSFTSKNLPAPFDIQIGISRKLNHLPFRVGVVMHRLNQWALRYDGAEILEETDIFGENEESSSFTKSVDNLFRHLIFNGEFLLGKNQNLNLRISYNHQRRKELSLFTFRSMAGFGLGFGMKINRFKLDYGIGYHHLAGANNHLSVSTNLDYFKKKV